MRVAGPERQRQVQQQACCPDACRRGKPDAGAPFTLSCSKPSVSAPHPLRPVSALPGCFPLPITNPVVTMVVSFDAHVLTLSKNPLHTPPDMHTPKSGLACRAGMAKAPAPSSGNSNVPLPLSPTKTCMGGSACMSVFDHGQPMCLHQRVHTGLQCCKRRQACWLCSY